MKTTDKTSLIAGFMIEAALVSVSFFCFIYCLIFVESLAWKAVSCLASIGIAVCMIILIIKQVKRIVNNAKEGYKN